MAKQQLGQKIPESEGAGFGNSRLSIQKIGENTLALFQMGIECTQCLHQCAADRADAPVWGQVPSLHLIDKSSQPGLYQFKMWAVIFGDALKTRKGSQAEACNPSIILVRLAGIEPTTPWFVAIF